ncbi:MAG: transporter substrate-binding domain-containing protein [Clostridia bacterium]|nr:transporter substrate-binding domain-containing protein [Clostridia bacterium]
MKKILSVVLAVVLAFGMVAAFSSCTQKSDWEKIQEKGYFYCGITLYAPMNYYENDELVGFDTEFAQAVAEYLGVEAKFVTIKWPQKYLELDSGAIDAILPTATRRASPVPSTLTLLTLILRTVR